MSTPTSLERMPKRVILRLRVAEFEDYNYSELRNAIKAYLIFAGYSPNEIDENQHFAHIEPFQAPELQQISFHIILDMEKDMIQNPDFNKLPHEIYRVRRDEQGELQVRRIQNPLEEQNFLNKMRRFTDKFYAWAK